MPKLGDAYERGNFLQMLAGAYKPNVSDMVSPRSYFGLVPSLSFAYGNVKTEDGQMYELSRNFDPSGGQAVGYAALTIQSTEIDGKNLIFDMELTKNAASSNGCLPRIEGMDAVWSKEDGVEGKGFEVRCSEDTFSWTEDGVFSFSGSLIKPGLHWYLPGRDYGTYYVSLLCAVDGKIKGQNAKGFMGFDQVYMAEDAILYLNKDLVMENKGHLFWYIWGTRYKDGTVEAGHFILGHDRMGFAIMTDGKDVIATQNIEGHVIYSEQNTPFGDRIEITVDGVQWEFLSDPRGKMPAMLQKYPPTPQQEGRWRRVGDTREPDAWFAWGETEPKHGTTREPKFPTRR